MGNVLGELPLQHVLLPARALQLFVYLDDFLGYLSQFVVGEVDELLGLQRLVVTRPDGKGAQFGYVLAQPVCEVVEYDDQYEDCSQCKPQVMLVCLERFGQVVVVGQSATHDEAVVGIVGSRVEEVTLHRIAAAFDGRPRAMLERLLDFRARGVVANVGFTLGPVVIDYHARRTDEGHSQSRCMVPAHIVAVLPLGGDDTVVDFVGHAVVEVLQPDVERVYLELFLPCLLIHDERAGEDQKHGDDAYKQLLSYRGSPHSVTLQRNSRNPALSRCGGHSP